ncbi:MAG: hypothetical protein PHQ24_12905 [Proteiniphilum sp.]|jgi:hypothetical protein|nr:hypothetical protein [Proteiniphilum sp.]
MAKFRKKPVEVEAVRLTERTEIQTLEGTMIGNPGDWLITGVAGEKYPCKDEIFRVTYTMVSDCKICKYDGPYPRRCDAHEVCCFEVLPDHPEA